MELKIPDGLRIDPERLAHHLERFIKKELERTGFTRLVLGISGGIDSTVVAYLSAAAIGPANVTGVVLPYAHSTPENIKDAEMVISRLGLNRRTVDITPMVEAYFKDHPTDDRTRRGNKMARERMSVLYDISAELGALVIGTSNKSEILMGYGTLFGDLACALNPLGNLYKTQLRQLAEYLGVPPRILGKAPSADLWAGQTDEGELGLTYEKLDTLLYHMIDRRLDNRKLEKLGFGHDLIDHVRDKIARNEFKGHQPRIAELPG